jgi:hypothetical protein
MADARHGWGMNALGAAAGWRRPPFKAASAEHAQAA